MSNENFTSSNIMDEITSEIIPNSEFGIKRKVDYLKIDYEKKKAIADEARVELSKAEELLSQTIKASKEANKHLEGISREKLYDDLGTIFQLLSIMGEHSGLLDELRIVDVEGLVADDKFLEDMIEAMGGKLIRGVANHYSMILHSLVNGQEYMEKHGVDNLDGLPRPEPMSRVDDQKIKKLEKKMAARIRRPKLKKQLMKYSRYCEDLAYLPKGSSS